MFNTKSFLIRLVDGALWHMIKRKKKKYILWTLVSKANANVQTWCHLEMIRFLRMHSNGWFLKLENVKTFYENFVERKENA